MALQLDTDDEVISSINVTPFVDIVLVLLIIFMATSTYIARGAFDIDLPRAASAGEEVPSTINLVLSADGEAFLNGNPVTEPLLIRWLKQAGADTADMQAAIAADKSLPYGDVVKWIDVLKQHGVVQFALNLEKVPLPTPSATDEPAP
jgi:biopolymer transport protein TolR